MTDIPKPIAEEPELSTIFDTSDEAEAWVVQGLLESSGIESLLVNIDAPQDVLPGVGGVVLKVRPSQADEARAIIETQRSAEPSEPEPEEDASDSEIA